MACFLYAQLPRYGINIIDFLNGLHDQLYCVKFSCSKAVFYLDALKRGIENRSITIAQRKFSIVRSRRVKQVLEPLTTHIP